MSTVKQRILVIDDEPAMRKFLRAILESQDFHFIEAATGEDGLRKAAAEQPDLMILDLGLPDMSGMAVAKRLREWSTMPIIVVSARGKEQDKVIALDAGADDYLTKPFGVAELLARVRVAMRHKAAATQPPGEPVFQRLGLCVDLANRKVLVDGNAVHLTPNEFRLLALMVKNAGKVLTHRYLLDQVWGPNANQEVHYLRVYMNQLRQKIEKDPAQPMHLLTEPGVGYRLASDD